MTRELRFFLRLLDSLPLCLIYFDAQGRRLHANADATHLLRTLPNPMEIARGLAELARICRPFSEAEQPEQHSLQWVTGTFASAGVKLEARAARIPLDLFGDGEFVLVVLSTPARAMISCEELQATFRLTPQQARTALALAAGLSNREIAEQLSISEHTARRHTEQVLLKLNVRSRAQVAELVARPERRKRSSLY